MQKEVCTFVPDGRTKTVMLVDAAQQTGKNTATIIQDAYRMYTSSGNESEFEFGVLPASVIVFIPVVESELKAKTFQTLSKQVYLRTIIFLLSVRKWDTMTVRLLSGLTG